MSNDPQRDTLLRKALSVADKVAAGGLSGTELLEADKTIADLRSQMGKPPEPESQAEKILDRIQTLVAELGHAPRDAALRARYLDAFSAAEKYLAGESATSAPASAVFKEAKKQLKDT